ncbi:MAG: hypothetical protein FJ347_09565 [Sphingomonadales bacterium]|nr:hypothetical protein [Sphingomonadales bacterium]
MKNRVLMLLFLGISYAAGAQIAEVKIDGTWAKIYDENARYSGKSISLSGNKSLEGYNNRYIVIKDGTWAKIYDENARYTGKSISLSGDKYIKNVSGSAILIKDGSWVKYYDFDGRYTGKSTPDR